MSTSRDSSARAIVENLGGAENIASLTHCATRLRLELHDVGKVNEVELDAVPGVLGTVHQGDSRYQVICGGGVESMYTAITHLPEMKNSGAAARSDADVKEEARSKARGKYAWLDNFFEYLSDSFRPILGVLLGASLIIAIAAVLDAFHVIDFRDDNKSATWVFFDAMWRSVFYFLPLMVAYNAAKKLRVDPWLGAAIMGALMTPEFMSLSDPQRFPETVSTTNEALGKDLFSTTIFGLPMQLNDYGGQVFVPLIMVAILAVVYHALKKIFPDNVQMVFVPFISMLIMIPLTAFFIGPLGIWLGNGIGTGLAWMNSNAPFIFAILIPMLYPFLVPLGLHWPLNALMLVNIQTLGYDFIQGPMGVWNFACFGATAGVLALSMRDHDTQMRQTASGALAAGLFGGISEPSLYGIHLRFKRIYPRMLLGCFAGGVTIAILSAPFEGVKTQAFVFTSLLTTVVFNPVWVYIVSIAVAFFVAMFAIVLTDYRTPEEKAEAAAAREAERAEAERAEAERVEPTLVAASAGGGTAVATAIATIPVQAPVAGELVSLAESGDKVFASGALGAGVGIVPRESAVVAPVTGTLVTVAKTGHAFGIKTDEGVEVLVHVGIDTVKMDGEGFEVAVEKKQRVKAGDLLTTVDFDAISKAGYPTTTLITVTNSKKLSSVEPLAAGTVSAGDTVIEVQP
ncbi:glucose PTS transporter subunit IIA [Corynebacterium mayonis]|uniref:glucose PTS transporter subunit IIA n=1 Tax=Corynebacterium mayonis TaxID=3062461 RepID=UPI0031408F02